jgi:transposase
MLKNRIHSILHRRGILNPLKDLFTKEGRRWLGEMKLDEAGRLILDRYLSVLDHLQETIDESTSALGKLSRQQRWCKQVALLRTMPGIGPITSLTILAELGDIDRFKSRAGVSNYVGIVPVVRNSNQKSFSGHITHRGPAHLRSALVEAAWTAVGRVPQYATIYNRIAAKKAKQIAIVAVARRILEDAWTMLKKEEVFRLRTVTSNVTDVRISERAAADCESATAVTVPNAG